MQRQQLWEVHGFIPAQFLNSLNKNKLFIVDISKNIGLSVKQGNELKKGINLRDCGVYIINLQNFKPFYSLLAFWP